jgi:SHO1 osmosensor
MPSYGALSTPSLRKMENGHGYGQRSTFSVGRIIGDPFALATISIGIVSAARRGSFREADS